ncbi:protein indeterminate-domain 12-like [Salvia hispanica]|uniref:protein indeterminate-domain 12-like n=1 Tax=Salvia hispanica TaxID=49212 RepID=UPI0020099A8F|nr:protein indeterminate-domain 12-like [Salvia hispanica]
MFPMVIPNSSEEGTNSSRIHQSDLGTLNSMLQNSNAITTPQMKIKKKRNLPGNPDPDAEVIALSPKTLMTANRFVCEICNKGFQRDQNLQLHRRGHNLPWKLKQRSSKENRKRAYVCPEPSCLHHHPSRALGDLTGIKKHYCRKHGEKKWKCDKCSKIYAVQSDWKAHSKTCGTREYRCDCGTLFSRKDSFITHRAFCDALAEESARLSAATNSLILPQQNPNFSTTTLPYLFSPQNLLPFRNPWGPPSQNPNPINLSSPLYQENRSLIISSSPFGNSQAGAAPLSATALLQKAATMGATGNVGSTMAQLDMHKTSDGLTRDFLGLTGDQCSGGGLRELQLPLVKVSAFERDHNSVLKQHGFGFTETCSGWGNC